MRRFIQQTKTLRGMAQAAAEQQPATQTEAGREFAGPCVRTAIPGPESQRLSKRLSDIQVSSTIKHV